MSAPKLPTLYALLDKSGQVAMTVRETWGIETGVVPYVPASALEEANEALRLERAEVERLRGALELALHVVDEMARQGVIGTMMPEHVRSLAAARTALSPRPGAKESLPMPTRWHDAVKMRMVERGETFTSIARTTGMSAPGVHKAVKGNATLATMERIASALGCELNITLVPARRAKESP